MFFSFCHMNIDLFPEINFWQWWHFSNNINIFPALSQKYFCQTFLWFSWKSIQCFYVTLIVAEGLEVIYWICSVWTKHFSVGSSANSASQTFPSSSRQRQKFWRPCFSSVDGAGGVKKVAKYLTIQKQENVNDLQKIFFCLHLKTRNRLGWNDRRLLENAFSTKMFPELGKLD